MKWITTIMMAALLCGCANTQREHALMELDKKMSPEWLKENVVVGKTTKTEVHTWFGRPMNRTASASSGFASDLMPDEIWSYAVRFSAPWEKGLDMGVNHWTRSLAFSFKGDVVMNYNAGETGR